MSRWRSLRRYSSGVLGEALELGARWLARAASMRVLERCACVWRLPVADDLAVDEHLVAVDA